MFDSFNTILSKCIKKNSQNILLIVLSLIILLSLLSPLLVINKYNHPATFDDFSNLYSFSNFPEKTLFSALKPGYRYSIFFTYFFYWVINISPNLKSLQRFIIFYRLYSIFIILFFFVSVYILLFTFNKYYIKTKTTIMFFVYSLFIFSVTNFINHFAFFFYDIISTGGYTVGLCLSILLISCVPSYYYNNNRRVPIVLLAFIICGKIEYYTILVAYIAFIVICIKYYKKKKIDWFMCSLIVMAFIIALSYGFSPWVHEKASLYSGRTENIYAFKNFAIFFKSIIKFFIYALKDYLSLKLCILHLILVLFAASFFQKKQIRLSLLFYISFILFICFMSLTLFLSGIFQVDRKTTSVMIFRFFSFMVFTLFFAQCFVGFYTLFEKICKNLGIINEINLIKIKLGQNVPLKNMVCNTASFLFLSFFLVNIVFSKLPLRNIIYELYKGYAKTYNSQVWQIYKDLLDSKEETVVIYEPDVFIQTSLIQGIWLENIYENYNEWLIPEEKFFNKKIIIKKRSQEETK